MTIPKVLVLYTGSFQSDTFGSMHLRLTHLLGGTIGMKVIRKAYEPVVNYLPEALRDMNIMHDVQFARTMADIDTEKAFLYLPLSFSSTRSLC